MSERLSAKLPRMDPQGFMTARHRRLRSRRRCNRRAPTSLEGLLFPDTYRISADETPAHIAQRMIDLMDLVVRQEDVAAKAEALGLSPYQVLIIASMIEREAKVDEDRPKIARVILNRFQMGMPLQIDATLLYGQPAGTSISDVDQPRHAVQHVPAHRATADTDRQPRPGLDPGRRQPGARSVAG